jgi:hypothetical protein
MQSLIKKINAVSIAKLHLMIVIFGILIAAQIQYIQHGWINPDSVLYLESAKLFVQWQWKEALQVWNWPLYPICISLVHKITTLNIHTSAQLLNVIFFGITTYSFIQIIRLGGGQQLTIVAGALILLSSQYIVGDVLKMLMRDEGFWAFYLTALVFFIRFYQNPNLKDALLWQLSVVIATLFRIEAITYLVFLPSILLIVKYANFKTRLKHFAMAHSFNLALSISLISALAFYSDVSMKKLGRLEEIFTLNLFQELTRKLFTQSAIMAENVLGKHLDEFAIPALLLTFIYVIIYKTVTSAGLFNVLLAFFGIKRQYAKVNSQRVELIEKTECIETKTFDVMIAVGLISILNMSLIITKVFVLTGRYVVAFTFLLMIIASFQLGYFIKRYSVKGSKQSRLKWAPVALCVLMLLGLVKNILPKMKGYNYMQSAVEWVINHDSNALKNNKIFFNESRLRYFAGAPFIGGWDDTEAQFLQVINNKTVYQFEYLLLATTKKEFESIERSLMRIPEYKVIARFNDAKEKKMVLVLNKKEN